MSLEIRGEVRAAHINLGITARETGKAGKSGEIT